MISTLSLFLSQAVEREQVDSIQPKLQHVNAVGQGLIQSAAKHTDTQALEHDLETTNLKWNSLNKRVRLLTLHQLFAQLQLLVLYERMQMICLRFTMAPNIILL